MVTLCLTLWRAARLLSNVAVPLPSQQQQTRVPVPPHFCQDSFCFFRWLLFHRYIYISTWLSFWIATQCSKAVSLALFIYCFKVEGSYCFQFYAVISGTRICITYNFLPLVYFLEICSKVEQRAHTALVTAPQVTLQGLTAYRMPPAKLVPAYVATAAANTRLYCFIHVHW